jgi:pyrroline-5-carboxylate reductase
MENKKIAVIGAGSMGGAILSGLIAAGTAADSITASTATTQSAKSLSDKFGIKSFALATMCHSFAASYAYDYFSASGFFK